MQDKPNVRTLLESFGERLVDELTEELRKQRFVNGRWTVIDASGELIQSVRFTVQTFGLTSHFELHMADYYQWVDEGRRAGKRPPVSNILKWIKDKRLVISPKYGLQSQVGGKRNKKTVKVSDNLKMATRLAWAIATNIGKHGTKPTNFYTPVKDAWLADLRRELPKALKRDIIIEVREAIK